MPVNTDKDQMRLGSAPSLRIMAKMKILKLAMNARVANTM
jgi:hypothetical protein